MAVVVVPNAFLVTARGTVIGRPWANVFGVQSGPNGTGGGFFMDQAAADALGGAVRSLYAALQGSLSTSWTLTDITVADLQSATAPSWDATVTGLTGTATAQAMPSHLAVVASHKTGMRGKSYRGRTYLAGYTEDANSVGGVVHPNERSVLEAAFDTMRTNLAAITDGDFRQSVISRHLEIATEVIDTTVDELWDRQNRRKV